MIKQLIKPNRETLKLKDVVIDVQQSEPAFVENQIILNSTTPTVFYYNAEIPVTYIKKLTLDSNAFLPTCFLVFEDSLGIMTNVGFPGDNAKLTVVYPSNHPNLANIFMEFKIIDYNVEISRDTNLKKIYIWGICNIEQLLISKYESFKDKTSLDVFTDICNISGLGLMSNVDSSSDKMTWLNPAMNRYKFLQDMINKSWVGEAGFVWGFVDWYYNLNYINVDKSLSLDITEIQWVESNMVDRGIKITEKDEVKLIPALLSNESSLISSNVYFSGEKVFNKSTNISLNRGYLRNVHYYDVDGNWKDKAGTYYSYVLDTITTSGNDETTIYLKGEPGDLDFYNNNQSFIYKDKIDTKNMYPDFLWASVQNEENLYDLQKISMRITLINPNFNLKRYEKIKLYFTNDNIAVQNTPKNVKLNGEWLVTGTTFEWNGTAMYQYVNIVKRELTVNEI